MIGFGELRRGTVLELDGAPWQVLEYQHNRMQKRAPVLTLKLRSLKTGHVMERNFPGDHKLTLAAVEERQAQYLYQDGESYYFMDMESYDQFPLSVEQLGDALNYLKEQLTVGVVFYRGDPLTVELPTFVDLQVAETPPGFRGDTAQGGTKPATLETGLTVQVPLFINPGERVRVDTRTGQYLERAG